MEQTVDVPVPQHMKMTETECVAPAVSRRRRTAKRVAPSPATDYAAPDEVIEYVAASAAATCAAQASVFKHATSSLAVAYAAPAPVREYVEPTPAASHVESFSRMNKEQLTKTMAAALAEAAAAHREILKADTTLADLA